MNEVLSQLDELLFSSVEGVLVESVEVSEAVVRVEARTTAGRAACPRSTPPSTLSSPPVTASGPSPGSSA
ncbi:hypothetical protein [Streptomyces sp. NBC_00525]|uniref:hypothetical protein n=1 Tax=Streptomyces sp. NBC_00525 TaxID=2903660 RepID=UPI002E811AB1|nr:hypothetical protein [Streptomyces sp. NBC_00525]WUC96849.1 hypothetical protein OG710_25980 [Streptomyces sp. NBC_00525]